MSTTLSGGMFGTGYPNAPGYKDTDTGMDAAIAIAEHAKTVQRRALEAFVNAYPSGLTPDQVASELCESILTVRPRCSELKRLGLIRETDATRKNNTSGVNARVMIATPAGIEQVPHE